MVRGSLDTDASQESLNLRKGCQLDVPEILNGQTHRTEDRKCNVDTCMFEAV